jgi:hypothetical protein
MTRWHHGLGLADELALQDAAADREDPGDTLSRTFSQPCQGSYRPDRPVPLGPRGLVDNGSQP